MLGLDAVLTADELATLKAALGKAAFADGKATAGWHARVVKQNSQLAAGDPAGAEARRTVEAALRRHHAFAASAQPKTLQMLFNLYGPGQSYGRHVDDAFMAGQRTDLAFTLFLSEPSDYEGGELVIETPAGEQRVRLPAGAAIVYPATTLHRVETVTSGQRLACVGWVESHVRDAGEREILFDLERARRALFEQHGKTSEFDLLSKVYANLQRRWAD